MAQPPMRPTKTREFQNYVMDSTRWNSFPFRGDDIVIGTWAKTGTTWVQQIVSQLIFGGADGVAIGETSPWIDMRIVPIEDILSLVQAQTHRRLLKTHLPLDALPMRDSVKYIYVGRDVRDVVWSTHAHQMNFSPLAYELFNTLPGRVGPPMEPPHPDIREYYRIWLERDGYPAWPFWSHVQSWWNARQQPNVLLVHFANLKADMEGETRRLAAFLDISIDEEAWPKILEHSSFAYMKRNVERVVGAGAALFNTGAKDFVNKGTNGRWRDILTAAEIARADEFAAANLSADCARWLATGKLSG
jgi:aryl sulfotransferase